MSNLHNYDDSNNFVLRLRELSETATVFESEGCIGIPYTDPAGIQAEQERIDQENMIKQLTWQLDLASSNLEECNRRKESTQAELERYLSPRVEHENKIIVDENASLSQKVAYLEEKYNQLKRVSEQSEESESLVLRPSTAPHLSSSDSIKVDSNENDSEEDSEASQACDLAQFHSRDPKPPEEEAFQASTLSMLKDQVTQLNSLFHRQEGTLKKFQEAIEENKAKNRKLIEVMTETKTEEPLKETRRSDRRSMDISQVTHNREYSEFLSSLMSLEDIDFIEGAAKKGASVVEQIVGERYWPRRRKRRCWREKSLTHKALCYFNLVVIKI